MIRKARLLYEFARPHTVIATSVQVITMLIIVAGWRPLTLDLIGLWVATWIVCLSLNLYVVGVNQLTDVAIDRINKPWLPIAAGRLSVQAGRWFVVIALIIALIGAWLLSLYLWLTVVTITLIGSLYSLPPFRLKRKPLVAAISIASARGVIANVGLALHYRHWLEVDLPFTTLVLTAVFFFGFALVIAFYKDLPDDRGDRMYQIETLTTRLGPRRVLHVGRLLLTACYLLPIAVGLWSMPAFAAGFLAVSHAIVIIVFWIVSLRVDLQQQQSITNFYMFLWSIFYTEFVLLSIYRLTDLI
ncbi:homogentisate phytyltransferase [Chloroflexus sp. MS-CIW-1]|uniref:homogentisate phytyltransferase n=1 Tax=Chloroflexus sp. MS-CIW-1 TaxID=3055768 RepID=UPI0026491867|nr:homogentisate phytyltransferase [Chloroflexus sp. MS-CIW-1]MDN5272446.1 homogentisate phytyltransferase [Chloroflexus sp. MS-CIW-1]